ncbi:MAG: Phosphomevalonate kinase [Labilithrix sp.]|nr:Phosphomevalonate kinase [Labilithrix sp.]
MTVVFAPGKLVLTGAYAVLTGAPAVVVATSRGAYADASRAAPTATPEVRAALGEGVIAPHVDASSLFVGARKLGLGASAAILVASLAAIDVRDGARLDDAAARASLFQRAYAAHAVAQGGGSGVDVAASTYGGVLEYQRGVPTARALPPGTVLTVFACAASARTSELRGLVDGLARRSPAEHGALLGELSAVAADAAVAVRRGDHVGFVGAMRRAARGLAALGAASGAPIVPAGFEVLEGLAAAEDAAFCVSGAGGGDVAVFAGSAPPSAAFQERARALGLFAIDLSVDEKGVRALSQDVSATSGGAHHEHAPTS